MIFEILAIEMINRGLPKTIILGRSLAPLLSHTLLLFRVRRPFGIL